MNRLIKQAFTLIELLVVIAIIGILSGLIVVSMSGVTQKATIAKAQVFSNSLKNSLMANIIGEWKFDEINAPSTDQTPDLWGGNTGTLKESGYVSTCDATHCPQLVSSNCIYGKCLSFDGINDYVDCGNNTVLNSLGNITISVWVKTNSLTTQQAVWGSGVYRVSFGSSIGGAANVKAIGFVETGVSIWALTPDNVLTDGWMNIVYSKNGPGATSSIYLNGTKLTLAINGSFTLNNSGNTLLGVFQNAMFFNGLMDEIRIYNVAISSSQIKENYYLGLNNLLINGSISKQEYLSRFNNYAVK